MAAHLRVYSRSGTMLGILPEHTGFQYQIELNAPGSVKGTYPRNGLNASLLDQVDVRLAVVENGVENPQRFLLEDDEEDLANPALSGRDTTFSGRGLLAAFEWAKVYPINHTPGMSGSALYNLHPYHDFGSKTPGYIMRVLIERAQARGALTGITLDFGDTLDSAGTAWPNAYTVKYDTGIDYLQILTAMADNAWVDMRMNDSVLQMFSPGTTLATDRPGLILRNGREVTQGPRKRTRTPIRSHILGVGDQGAITESGNSTIATAYGRREGYEARSGITDVGTLQALTNASLTSAIKASEGFTLIYDSGEGGPVPLVDYHVGDYIRWDKRRLDTATLEPLRVRSIAVNYAAAESPSKVSIELNDLFVEASIKLKRKVDGIVGGSSSNSRVPQSPDSDASIPGATLAVNIASTIYQAGTSQVATATISWPAVTTNADGTPYLDARGYEIAWRLIDLSTAWPPETMVAASVLSVDTPNHPPGSRIQARVRAVDLNNNRGAWVTSGVTTLAGPNGPASSPSDPTVTQIAAGLRVFWDGLLSGGSTPNLDFSGVTVHVSATSAAFVPSATTARDFLPTAGFASITGLTVGATYWVKLVGVDRYGQVSTSSAAVPGSGIIVRGANDGEVADLSVSKLTAGVLTADMAVSGRIATKLSVAATYTWVGGMITVATVGGALHGLTGGQNVYLDFASGAGSDGSFGPVTVTDATHFTVAAAGSGAGGNVTVWSVDASRVEIGSGGIRAYGATGVQTILLNGITSTINAATISGSSITGTNITLSGGAGTSVFATATSGPRVEMLSDASAALSFYTGSAVEGFLGNGGINAWESVMGTTRKALFLDLNSPTTGGGRASLRLRGTATATLIDGVGSTPRAEFILDGESTPYLSLGYWTSSANTDNTGYLGLHRRNHGSLGTDNSYLVMTDAATGALYLSGGVGGSARLRGDNNSAANEILVYPDATSRVSVATHFAPATDNALNLGATTLRWKQLFAGTATISTSDIRHKTDVEALTQGSDPLGLAFIRALRPVRYRFLDAGKDPVIDPDTGLQALDPDTGARVWRNVEGKRPHTGFLAQEVREALATVGVPDWAGWTISDPDDPDSLQGLRYEEFIAPLVAAVQHLADCLDTLTQNGPPS